MKTEFIKSFKTIFVFLNVLLLIFICNSSVAANQYRNARVTIPQFESNAQNAEKWLKVALADMTANDLVALGRLNVVPRRTLNKIMDEQKIQQSGAINQETASEIGKLVGADLLISGSYQLYDDFLRLNATVYEVETGESAGAANVSGSMEEVFVLQKELVGELLENLGFELSRQERLKMLQLPTDQLDALEKNYLGKIALERGDKKQARDFFVEAKNLDPEFKEPIQNLKEIELDQSKLTSELERKFDELADKENLKGQHKELVPSLLEKFVKNLWKIKVEELDYKKDIEVIDPKTAQINVTFSVGWNYEAIQQLIKLLEKYDAGKNGETKYAVYYKLHDDKSLPKRLIFNSFPKTFSIWSDLILTGQWARQGQFKSAVRINVVDDKGAVWGRSDLVKWERTYNDRGAFLDSALYIQPLGSYKYYSINELNSNDPTPKSSINFTFQTKIKVDREDVLDGKIKSLEVEEQYIYLSDKAPFGEEKGKGWVRLSDL